MEYTIAKQISAQMDADYSAACKALGTIPGVGSGPMGLTPDDVLATPEYKAARTAMNKAFAQLRAFNAVYVKQFKKELAAERKIRRA